MEDEREVELFSISAIFPEIVLDTYDPFSASIELPVKPRNPVAVTFPESLDGPPQTPLPTPPLSVVSGQENTQDAIQLEPAIDIYHLTYFPSLLLKITLPLGYPHTKPPKFQLSTVLSWLSQTTLSQLEADGERIWEEFGHDEIVFAYIDHLQQAAENLFGMTESGEILQIHQDYKTPLLGYDIRARQADFEKETFDCGICLSPKKGSVCHKMTDCGHVFCVQCLQDFYNNAINEGDLTIVRCLAPNCAKMRAETKASTSKKHQKPKTQLSPIELLQIPLENDMVTRYVKLKHKADLESDKNTIYCPRKWCQGAARSKKHRKPEGYETVESGEDGSDTDEPVITTRRDLLSVCEDCSFAFCSRCYLGWHGEFKLCAPRTTSGELTEEDKASLEYLKLHTTPCPTCAAPTQKTQGCNHMICFKCGTHFCYLCSAWLEPLHPYKHFNKENTSCFMRLWDLSEGDGNDVGIDYAGGVGDFRPGGEGLGGDDEAADDIFVVEEVAEQRHFQWVQQDALAANIVPEIEEAEDFRGPEMAIARPPVEREGPLVFRINQLPPRPPLPAPEAPVARPRNARRPGQRQVRQQLPRQQQGRARHNPPAAQPAVDQDAVRRAWVQRFVQMALNDEEDDLESDSDDDGDIGAWEIPVR